jgi:ubiquinone/menaquinone biosynthesis C-methylase UbiE
MGPPRSQIVAGGLDRELLGDSQSMSTSPERIQQAYYERTASQYDDMHVSCEIREHNAALEFINLLCDRFKLKTLLDVGAGTGRGVRFFQDRGREVRGVEPVKALIEQAEMRGVPKGLIVQGTGYSLPFEDECFDAVFECGVLHHVAEPSRVVSEMKRVAKRAVFLSDDNRFGHGRRAVRMLKLALYKSKLWTVTKFIQTRGKMYGITEGDGLAYSYSVFDSYEELAEWGDTIWLIPTANERTVRSWLHPLITSQHILLCVIKNGVR